MQCVDKHSIIGLSPYPITRAYTGSGAFCWGTGLGIWPYQQIDFEPYIEIPDCLPDADCVAILLHEIGHALCFRKHCRCFAVGDNRYLRELHAYRFALRYMVRYKLIDALQHEYDNMVFGFYEYLPIYQKAVRQIKREKIWQEIEKILDIS